MRVGDVKRPGPISHQDQELSKHRISLQHWNHSKERKDSNFRMAKKTAFIIFFIIS